jgi:hypothetical protein
MSFNAMKISQVISFVSLIETPTPAKPVLRAQRIKGSWCNRDISTVDNSLSRPAV